MHDWCAINTSVPGQCVTLYVVPAGAPPPAVPATPSNLGASASAGNYDLEARVSSGGTGGTFHIKFNAVNKTGALSAPGTGGWQTWQSLTKTGLSLSAGPQVMLVVFDTGGYNLNSLRFIATTTPDRRCKHG